ERVGLRSGPGPQRFAIAENCSPQPVVVVDDVYTTGAGINNAAVALAGGGHDVLRRIRDSPPRQSRLPPRGGAGIGRGGRDRPTSDHRNSQRGLANLHRARATSIRRGRAKVVTVRWTRAVETRLGRAGRSRPTRDGSH